MSTGQLIREPDVADRAALPSGGATRATASGALPSLRFRRIRALVLLVAVVAVVWGGVRLIGWAVSDDGAGAGTSVMGRRAGHAPPPPTSESASATLAEALDARTQGIKGDTAAGVLDLTTGVTATYAADKTFATASIVKVDILASLLLQKDGELTQGQSSAAKRMIQNSDNKAATSLWKAIGGAKGLTEANQTLGLTSTTAGTKARWGLTTTTAADQLRLLRVIFTEDSPLSAESRGYIRTLMGSVADDQEWGISAADDPGGSKVYVKNGWLPRSGGWIVNSVGEVEHGGHKLLVVALSNGRPSKDLGIGLLEDISVDAVRATVGG